MLSVGIVGLPNSGKSTLFNTLLKKQVANVADYPFTTIEPNVGVVEVPDERLEKLVELIKPDPSTLLRTAEPKVIPAAVKFIDIAGLVKDAHKGEGLGNQFLAKIRECDAIIHLLRGFKNENISHYYGSIDPERDREIVDIELELGGIKKHTLYVLNSNSNVLTSDSLEVSSYVHPGSVIVNAKTGEGVDQLIKKAFELLDLITFYTVKPSSAKASEGRGVSRMISAWPLKKGMTALEAAERVHTDMAQGFIKAEVISFQDLAAIGGWQKAKSVGKVRLEGRDYQVQDGDVIEFKFNR